MKPRNRESGYAMLLVFLMAACVAIMLYMELPRVAFEAERQREIQLVDRGNQFKRAIQVFVTDKVNNAQHRYPASIDELESFNNHRYLRRRYVDPMTGKDEWRLVHINGGVLTDSVTMQNKNQSGTAGSTTPAGPAYISEQTFLDSGPGGAGAAGGAARALRQRPSEQQGAAGEVTAGGSMGMQGDAGGSGGGIPGIAVPGAAGGVLPTLGGGQTTQQQQQQQPCTVYIGSCPQTTTNNPTGQQQGQPPQVMGGVPGLQGNQTSGGPGGVPGMPGGAASNAQSAAASMIAGLLTGPRPQGMPTSNPGAAIGGGVAGVASKYQAEGIMVINDRTAINEWEYIFDATKYRPPPNPLTGPAAMPQQGQPVGTPASQMGTMPPGPGQQQPTTPVGPGGGGRQ